MDIKQQLAERYQSFPVPIGMHADSAHQLCIRADDGSKLYFINVYMYDYGKITGFVPRVLACLATFGDQFGYQAECYFKGEDGLAFDVMLHHDWKTIEQMETFFHKMYHNMNCKPYED